MKSSEIREKYLKFFEERGHKRIEPAPLVLENDPSTLFTSAGMQPLVRYLKGEVHPGGRKLTDSQLCLRTNDIVEVGDNRHLTVFEMLGNWSLGDYFKRQQLIWIWEFITEELEIDKNKLHVSVFEGDELVPKDTESLETWKELGVPEDRISFYNAKKNWWSLSGPPSNMKPGEIGGPDSEIFYDFGTEHDPAYGDECHPNCDCGRFLEIGNSVFIQYEKKEDGSLQELPQRNVDFGGGLERILAVIQGKQDLFETDLYVDIIVAIEETTGKSYKEEENKNAMRVIADHLKGASLLISDGVRPSNKEQGYTLRRLIRRALVKFRALTGGLSSSSNVEKVVGVILDQYERTGHEEVKEVLLEEMDKFIKTLDKGMKELQRNANVDGKVAFDLYQTYGFPLEITEEILTGQGKTVNHLEFEEEFEKHKELSRTSSAGMFKGGLASSGEQETKYHTATHLLHAALRKVLGDHVLQRGSNITAERMRFDFSHTEKVTDEELKEVESLINEQIGNGIAVIKEDMSRADAENSGAIGAFGQKYGERVTVYSIGNFSKEFCGGPHVANTSDIGHVTITKEESAGAGTRRIYATIS